MLPTKDAWKLDDGTVRSALRFMLGVAVGPTEAAFFRCLCGQHAYSVHHAMSCPSLAGFRTSRHNFMQALVRYLFSAGTLSTSMEPLERLLKTLRAGDKGYGKRGDIICLLLDEILNVDLSMIHPAAQEYRAAAAKGPGEAAKIRDRQKRNDHAKEGNQGYTFVPFSIETYGRLGKPAEELLKSVADVAASTGAVDRNTFLQWSYKELSVRLVKANQLVFKAFCGAVTKSVGTDFRLGEEVPACE